MINKVLCKLLKKKLLVALSIFFGFNFSVVVFASVNQNIRVGLESKYKEKVYIAVENKNLKVGYDLHNSYANGASITGTDFKIMSSNNYYIILPTSFNNYYDAEKELENYPYSKLVGIVDTDKYAVVLGPFKDEIETNNILNIVGSGYVISNRDNLFTLFDASSPKALFTNNFKNPQIADGMNENIKLSPTDMYRGIIEFLPKENNTITPVNIINREQYLYSVVPSEMPKSWEMEALKAQSLAARTYSIMQVDKHSHDGYNVCDKIHCQVYTGIINENERTTTAVNETFGQAIYYQDSPIDALFYSSSGGITVNSEDAWSATVPYLRNVIDKYETTGLEWQREFTFKDINEIASNKEINIGNIYNVAVTKKNDLGRTTAITLYGSNGEHTLEGESIRTFFNISEDGSLKSTNFTLNTEGSNKTTNTVVTEITDIMILVDAISVAYKTSDVYIVADGDEYTKLDDSNNMYVIGANGDIKQYGKNIIQDETLVATGDSVTFLGRGWGHGVGMSQHGANGMAQNGYNYAQIIDYYYTDVVIKNIY